MDNVLVKFLPFECRLTLIARRRLNPLQSFKQWLTGEDAIDRNLLIIDFDMLSYLLKQYFDDYFELEFRNSLYAPFRDVVLTSTDGRRMLSDSDDVNHRETDGIVESMFHIEPIKTSSLRKRRGEVFNVSKKYDGVAVFTRDGDMPIPSKNTLQSKQLQAHADEDNRLLFLLQDSPSNTGLNNVAAVSLSVDVYNGGGVNNNTPQQNAKGYDFIIIVAVIVAGCSMILLAFALYLAFRRRNYAGAIPLAEAKLSPRTETELSPTSNRQTSPPPPVKVMEVYPEHDDNISDYTESVYSLPVQTKKQRIKEGLAQASSRKHQKISSRFNPRYIISSKKSNDGGSERSSDDDETSFGIPQLTSSEKTKNSESKNNDIDIISSQTYANDECLPQARSGLYPAEIIDDDITSSLSAYGKGIDIQKQYKLQNNDDGVSLSSYESYGFSLDGVGDQSTMANSTKYGY